MPNIFDSLHFHEIPFLEELADDLEGTFHVIAHAGYERNLPYIRNSQKHFREKYGEFIEHVKSDIGYFLVIPAYEGLQNLLDNNPTPEQIIDNCEECLEQYLMRGESSEDDTNPFQKFFK